MKKIVAILLGAAIAIGSVMPAQAAEQPSKCVLMASEIIQNEKRPFIRQVFADIVKAKTEEAMPVTADGRRIVGVYAPNTDVYYLMSLNFVFGTTEVRYLTDTSKITMRILNPDSAEKELCHNDVKELYDACRYVKDITSGLTDHEKIDFIVSYIKSRIASAYNKSNDQYLYTMRAWNSGFGYCGTYTSLFYLFGLNVGLDVRTAQGKFDGINHVWDKVVIDGAEMNIDIPHRGNKLFAADAYEAGRVEFPYTDDYLTNYHYLLDNGNVTNS